MAEENNAIAHAYLEGKDADVAVACEDGTIKTIKGLSNSEVLEERDKFCKDDGSKNRETFPAASRNWESVSALGMGGGLEKGVAVIYQCKGSEKMEVTLEERTKFSSVESMLKDAMFAANNLLCSSEPPEDIPSNPYDYKSKNPHHKKQHER